MHDYVDVRNENNLQPVVIERARCNRFAKQSQGCRYRRGMAWLYTRNVTVNQLVRAHCNMSITHA